MLIRGSQIEDIMSILSTRLCHPYTLNLSYEITIGWMNGKWSFEDMELWKIGAWALHLNMLCFSPLALWMLQMLFLSQEVIAKVTTNHSCRISNATRSCFKSNILYIYNDYAISDWLMESLSFEQSFLFTIRSTLASNV